LITGFPDFLQIDELALELDLDLVIAQVPYTVKGGPILIAEGEVEEEVLEALDP
jgi:hypothetical protein